MLGETHPALPFAGDKLLESSAYRDDLARRKLGQQVSGKRSIFRQSLCVKELPVIYGEQAAAFMEFVSAEYEARDWTPG
jgi:hypothetical protein